MAERERCRRAGAAGDGRVGVGALSPSGVSSATAASGTHPLAGRPRCSVGDGAWRRFLIIRAAPLSRSASFAWACGTRTLSHNAGHCVERSDGKPRCAAGAFERSPCAHGLRAGRRRFLVSDCSTPSVSVWISYMASAASSNFLRRGSISGCLNALFPRMALQCMTEVTCGFLTCVHGAPWAGTTAAIVCRHQEQGERHDCVASRGGHLTMRWACLTTGRPSRTIRGGRRDPVGALGWRGGARPHLCGRNALPQDASRRASTAPGRRRALSPQVAGAVPLPVLHGALRKHSSRA